MKYVQYSLDNRQKIHFSMSEKKNPRVEKQVENSVSKRSLTSSKCHHTHWLDVHHWSKWGSATKGSLQTVKRLISREVTIFWKFQGLACFPWSPLNMCRCFFMFNNVYYCTSSICRPNNKRKMLPVASRFCMLFIQQTLNLPWQ